MSNTKTITARDCADVIEADEFHAEARDGGAAELWAFSSWDLLAGTMGEHIDTQDDIYTMLEAFRDGETEAPEGLQGLGIVTYGWAAPIDTLGNGAPSESAARRRVRLIACVVADGAPFSRVHFFDNGETFDDEGEATGSLSDALTAALIARL